MKNSDFDLDLRAGQLGESSVAALLTIDTVEVKRDLRWFDTGNLYIELECYNMTQGKYIPSGINVTKSTHWAFVLGDTVIVTPTEYIKELIQSKRNNNELREVSANIPPNPSRGCLITVNDVLQIQTKKGPEIKNV